MRLRPSEVRILPRAPDLAERELGAGARRHGLLRGVHVSAHGIVSSMSDKPVLLTGVKPTGDIHIGNYFGAIKPAIDLFKTGEYQTYLFVADYHTLNFIQDAEEMRRLTRNTVMTYLACGLDPAEAVVYKQSEVPTHTELCWIFDTITTMPYLQRAHAYKDAEAKGKEVSVGTFNYPMLMAADILLYYSDVLPVP